MDAGDLLKMIRSNGDKVKIRTYQNELSYNGAWSGKLSARKAVD